VVKQNQHFHDVAFSADGGGISVGGRGFVPANCNPLRRRTAAYDSQKHQQNTSTHGSPYVYSRAAYTLARSKDLSTNCAGNRHIRILRAVRRQKIASVLCPLLIHSKANLMKRRDLKTITAYSAVGLYGAAMVAVAVEHGREAIEEACTTPLECHAQHDLPVEDFDGSPPNAKTQGVATSTSTPTVSTPSNVTVTITPGA
jgi:hypothetical protein